MDDTQNNRWRRGGASIFLLSAAFLLAACGEKSVASTEDEFEANRMFDILHSRELPVEKLARAGEKPGWNIVVDEGWFGGGEAAVATQVLNDYGLPRAKETLPETTSPYGMTSEPEARKRQNREKEIQIEKQLYDLPGVIKVGVVIAQPDNSTLEILSRAKTLPTASVLIVQKEMPPKFSESDVKTQVSGTVTDLKPENIHVTTTYQPLREIPLEKLDAQRRSNRIYAVGSVLILLLASTLGAVWYWLKRRPIAAESNAEQITDGDGEPEISAANRQALKAGDGEI